MTINIRKASLEDIDELERIFSIARKFMAENGNPNQWGKDKPSINTVKMDIANGDCYVCENENKVVGTFTLIMGEDKTYNIIEDGKWSSDNIYAAIHRVASDGSTRGIAGAVFDFCKKTIPYLRIDTHKDNEVMLNAITKNGFKRCGTIFVEDGSSRIAFDFLGKRD